MQAQELEARESQATFEKKILEKIEDENSFLLCEVQAEKHTINTFAFKWIRYP
jgi:hypothetical protein